MSEFEIGDLITTNKRNGFRVIKTNDDDIVVEDLLTGDFSILGKTEHTYSKFDPREVLQHGLAEILREVELTNVEFNHIFRNMSVMIKNYII
jgi:hypothetical protein